MEMRGAPTMEEISAKEPGGSKPFFVSIPSPGDPAEPQEPRSGKNAQPIAAVGWAFLPVAAIRF